MNEKSKFAFFGTPEFAAIVLEKLIKAGRVPTLVICNPDRPTGRKKTITPPSTKLLAIKYNIPILQPEVLSISNFQFSIFNFDFFVVAAYAKIIPKEILEIPRLGTIGVHPSLLPKYRGPSPIQNAILNGETETGVTLFLLDEKIDHGSILAKQELKFPISNFQFPILSQKLAELGGDLLIETLPKFLNGEIEPRPQDETEATYTKKFFARGESAVGRKTEDISYIEPLDLEKAQTEGGEIAVLIERKIRALNPEPGVWSIKDSKRLKLLAAELINGKLKLKLIQFEGKKPQLLT